MEAAAETEREGGRVARRAVAKTSSRSTSCAAPRASVRERMAQPAHQHGSEGASQRGYPGVARRRRAEVAHGGGGPCQSRRKRKTTTTTTQASAGAQGSGPTERAGRRRWTASAEGTAAAAPARAPPGRQRLGLARQRHGTEGAVRPRETAPAAAPSSLRPGGAASRRRHADPAAESLGQRPPTTTPPTDSLTIPQGPTRWRGGPPSSSCDEAPPLSPRSGLARIPNAPAAHPPPQLGPGPAGPRRWWSAVVRQQVSPRGGHRQ